MLNKNHFNYQLINQNVHSANTFTWKSIFIMAISLNLRFTVHNIRNGHCQKKWNVYQKLFAMKWGVFNSWIYPMKYVTRFHWFFNFLCYLSKSVIIVSDNQTISTQPYFSQFLLGHFSAKKKKYIKWNNFN